MGSAPALGGEVGGPHPPSCLPFFSARVGGWAWPHLPALSVSCRTSDEKCCVEILPPASGPCSPHTIAGMGFTRPIAPEPVSRACGCVQHLAHSQPACVKQGAWTGHRSPGPSGPPESAQALHPHGPIQGLGHPAPPGETAAQRHEHRQMRPGGGGWAVRGPLPRAPRPVSLPAAWHPEQQQVRETAPGKRPPVSNYMVRSLFVQTDPGGPHCCSSSVLAAPGLCELQL